MERVRSVIIAIKTDCRSRCVNGVGRVMFAACKIMLMPYTIDQDQSSSKSEPMRGLAHSVHARRAILFAGAGLSISVGLPPWRELITRMGREFGFDDDAPVHDGRFDYPILAEYYRLRQGSIGPLRSWMDRNWF